MQPDDNICPACRLNVFPFINISNTELHAVIQCHRVPRKLLSCNYEDLVFKVFDDDKDTNTCNYFFSEVFNDTFKNTVYEH